jgi:hypothetical protein
MMKKLSTVSMLLLALAAGLAQGQESGVLNRKARHWMGQGSIRNQYPVPVVSRGQVTRVISRTAYFPKGPGYTIVYKAQQGTGAYSGARKTVIRCGKRWLTPSEMKAIKDRYKFSDKKFGIHKTTIISTIRKQPF